MSLELFLDKYGLSEEKVEAIAEEFRKNFREGHLFSKKEELDVLKHILGVNLFGIFVEAQLKEMPDCFLASLKKCGTKETTKINRGGKHNGHLQAG